APAILDGIRPWLGKAVHVRLTLHRSFYQKEADALLLALSRYQGRLPHDLALRLEGFLGRLHREWFPPTWRKNPTYAEVVRDFRWWLEAEVGRVFARSHFILGEAGVELELEFAKYCGASHAVAVASGTDALWLALEALGVGAGDEVVTVGNTCAPTIAAILQAGPTPVVVEVDPTTLTMDPARAEAALSARTKCLLPVHLYGHCANLGALRDLAERRGLFLVEDCAQAHGAEYEGRRAGTVGQVGCFSFYPTKNLGALGDGGMVVTHDAALAQRLRLLGNSGYAGANPSVLKGHNSRLDEVQAAVLLAGLDRLNEWNERRRTIAARYTAAFRGGPVAPPTEAGWARHVYHLYVVRSRERERVREGLR